ncbi:MAG: DegT/DnrJ/EryC1/StrS family aminotransferase [Methylococcaceae bacterium]
MVPYLDLKAQYRSMEDEIKTAIIKVLESGQYSLGNEVNTLEQEFSEYCHTQYGVGVNSGASALHLALLAAGIKPEDEVITVSATFVATVAAIGYTGGKAVLIDIEPHTLNMDARLIESAITDKTRVILPVHLHGHPVDMDPILAIARAYNLIVIEDAAQAHGARYKNKPVGGLGDMGCFSFYPGKNLGAYGEGGMIVTNNPDYAQTIRQLRDWGQTSKNEHRLKGYNYRMDNIQAAILRVKLKYLDEWNMARRTHAERYDSLLSDLCLKIPEQTPDTLPAYHVYALRTRYRDGLKQHLNQRNIQTGIHYPIPIHQQAAYTDLGYQYGDLPITEQAAQELLSLPMYPELAETDINTVCTAIREYLEKQVEHRA